MCNLTPEKVSSATIQLLIVQFLFYDRVFVLLLSLGMAEDLVKFVLYPELNFCYCYQSSLGSSVTRRYIKKTSHEFRLKEIKDVESLVQISNNFESCLTTVRKTKF